MGRFDKIMNLNHLLTPRKPDGLDLLLADLMKDPEFRQEYERQRSEYPTLQSKRQVWRIYAIGLGAFVVLIWLLSHL